MPGRGWRDGRGGATPPGRQDAGHREKGLVEAGPGPVPELVASDDGHREGDVENAQRSYDAILQRFTQTSLESQTTQSNVNLLTQATAPVEPAFPKIWLNMLLSVLVGALLAVGVTLLLELRDRRVRSLDDAVAALGLPVIGVLPRPGLKRLGSRGALPMRQRLLVPQSAVKEV